jgi:hypothetical protein
MFEDTKRSNEKPVNRRRTDNTMTKIKGQKDQQRFTKHYREN